MSFKKFLAIIMALVMVMSMVSCTETPGVQTTDDKTAAVNTAEPTAEPAEEATPEPTAEPEERLSQVASKIVSPDGAPALALAKMSYDLSYMGTVYYGLSPYVVDASTIATYVTGDDPQADICILPVNAASKLLGTGEKYKLIGSVTNGNLFLLTKSGEDITADNISSLIGKKVGVVNLANVPGLTTQVVLNRHNLKYNIVDNEGTLVDDAVNLVAVNASDVTPAGDCDYYVVPEPAASVKVQKAGFKVAASIQKLYSEDGKYPQAVIVMKNEFVSEQHVSELIDLIKSNIEWVKTADVEAIAQSIEYRLTEGMTPSLTKDNLSREAIEGCGLEFVEASENKEYFTDFLAELIKVNASAAKEVSDNFFITK